VVKRFQSVSDESEEVRLGTDELSTAVRHSFEMFSAHLARSQRAKCAKNAGDASTPSSRRTNEGSD